MTKLETLKERLGPDWLPLLYERRVRSQRTRSIELQIPERQNHAEIQYTLLGIELKVGKRRISCPDLATARYLLVFARLGCRAFAIPYNITKISVVADEMETVWQRTLLLLAGDKRTTAAIIKSIRREIDAAGAGAEMPEFDTVASTRSLMHRK